MAGNFSNLNRDLFGRDLWIRGKLTIDSDCNANLHNIRVSNIFARGTIATHVISEKLKGEGILIHGNVTLDGNSHLDLNGGNIINVNNFDAGNITINGGTLDLQCGNIINVLNLHVDKLIPKYNAIQWGDSTTLISGNHANPLNINNIVLGIGSECGYNSVAIGSSAYANSKCVAIGGPSCVAYLGSTSMGAFNFAVNHSVSSGYKNVATNNSVALGYNNDAWGNSICIGLNTKAGIFFTDPNNSSFNNAVAIGTNSEAQHNGIAIGHNSKANEGYGCVSIGKDSVSGNVYHAVAIGQGNKAYGHESVALGYKSQAISNSSIAIGQTSDTHGFGSISIGRNTQTILGNSIAFGNGAYTNGLNSIAIGYNASTPIGSDSISIGTNTQATNGGISIGNPLNPSASIAKAWDQKFQDTLWNTGQDVLAYITASGDIEKCTTLTVKMLGDLNMTLNDIINVNQLEVATIYRSIPSSNIIINNPVLFNANLIVTSQITYPGGPSAVVGDVLTYGFSGWGPGPITLTNSGTLLGNVTLINDGSGTSLSLKGLSAGTGISLLSSGTDITISGNVTTLSNAGILPGNISLVNDGIGPDLAIKSLVAGNGITLLTTGTDVHISTYPIPNYTTTAMTGGVLPALTTTSTIKQYFTGTGASSINMPDETTLYFGLEYKFVNRSLSTLNINSSGGNLIWGLSSLNWGYVTCIGISGNTAASWSFEDGGLVN